MAMSRIRTTLRPLGRAALTPKPLTQPFTPTRLASTTPSNLKKTPLYDLHIKHGGKMVPFAEYSMPVQYASLSVRDSHVFTREHASLFDVSHMVQHTFSGPGAADALGWLSPADANMLPEGQARLSALLRNTGGIVDDFMITRTGPERFHVVTNAACRAKDLKFIGEELQALKGVDWSVEDRAGLIALQGPQAAAVLGEVLQSVRLEDLYFGQATYGVIRLRDGSRTREVMISRGGYTGEDGFEISLILGPEQGPEVVAKEMTALVETLMDVAGPGTLQLAGLGARDSLRLEAGMCLYGHDIDEHTTPVEAGLNFIIPKERRDTGGFSGAEVILPQLVPKSKGGAGVAKRRVGLVVQGAPAREGAELVSKEGEKIGMVTSGCPSPTLGKNIAMGYVKSGMQKAGTEVDVVIRGKKRPGVITKMPFVPAQYYREP